MRIETLRLIAIGPFSGLELDFGNRAEPRLHLIFGPNEAGKSSSLRALRRFLFGFPHKGAEDEFRHGRDELRVGATLVSCQGSRITAIRRRAKADSLRAGNDRDILREDALVPFLGQVTEEQFNTLWGIDHFQLRQGGEEILRGKGDVGQLLFATGLGLAKLSAVYAELHEEAEKLFLPRGRNQRITQTLGELKTLEDQRKAASLRPEEWLGHQKALEDARRTEGDLREKLKAVDQRLRRIELLLQGRPKRRAWQECHADAAALANVPDLPQDFSQQHLKVLEKLARVEACLKSNADLITKLQEERNALCVPSQILAAKDRIEQLYTTWGAIKKALEDRQRRLGELQALERESAEVGKLIGQHIPSLTDTLTLSTMESIRELVTKHERLKADFDHARSKLADLEEAEAEVAESSRPLLDLELIKAVREFLAETPRAETAILEAERRMAELDQQISFELARLPGWRGDWATLRAWIPPLPETIDRIQKQWDALEQRNQRHREELRQAEGELNDMRIRVDQLRQTLQPVTPDRMDKARQDRDREIESALLTWEARGAFDAGQAERVRASVRQADDLADRLARESQHMADFAQRERECLSLADRRNRLQAELAHDTENMNALRDEWARVWSDLGIVPKSPGEMRAWLRQRDLLVDLDRQRDAAQSVRSARQQELRNAEEAVHQAATSVTGLRRRSNESFRAWHDRVREQEAQLTKQHAEAGARQKQAAKLAKDRAKAAVQVANAEQRLKNWQTHWAQVVQPLGMDAAIEPAVASKVVAALEDLRQLKSKELELRHRIEAIDQDERCFCRAVADLTRELGQAAEFDQGTGAGAHLIELRTQATEAQKLADQVDRLERELAASRRERDGWLPEQAGARALLADLCRQARVASADDLTKACEAATQKRRVAERQSQLQSELDFLAASLNMDRAAFLAELAEVEARDLAADLAETKEIRAALQEQLEAVHRTIGENESELKRMTGAGTAAEIETLRCGVLARLEDEVVAYQRARLAARALELAIQRHRAAYQEPVLQRTGQFFRQLTRNSFSDVAVAGNELVGLRDRKQVKTTGMSDGTLDQLYLALRLASLEAYLVRHEPMPFIVDDILVHFDDDRAVAALEALATLSTRTQVLFFTHHRHLVDLARRSIPADQVQFHELISPR